MAMRFENDGTSTSKSVKDLADKFQRLADNNKFHYKRPTYTNKTNENRTLPTGNATIELGHTSNEIDALKSKIAEEIQQSFLLKGGRNNSGVSNVNPSQLSHRNRLSESCNQKEISNSCMDDSFECNQEVVNLVDELISTEHKYIADLNYIITEYLDHFRQHPISTIFRNIEAIFEHSQKFYTDLCSCKYDLQKIGATFLRNDVLFEKYLQHSCNYRRYVSYLSDYEKTVKDRTEALNDQFSMEIHMLKPYQRLARHKLLLENIQKANEASGKTCETIVQAMQYLDSKLNRADTLVAIDTIKNCPFDLTQKGMLLLNDAFTTKRKLKKQVFLFEEVIVFTEVYENQKDSFWYTDFIAMDSVYTIPPTCNYDTVVLAFESPDGKRAEIQIQTPNAAIGKRWITVINQLLSKQLVQAKVNH